MYRVKCTKTFAEFPLFHGECINLTFSQQQMQFILLTNFNFINFINYSNFFRRAIVDICTCKGDFWKSCFLQRTFGVLIALIFFRMTVVFENNYS